MTSVPHPAPTRLTHLTAELYGKEDDTLLAWQRSCAQAADTLRGAHDEERLRKALQLAQDGHVTLEADGSATVESRGKHYEVPADGACACQDAQHRGTPCKHVLAVQMHSLASASLRPGGDHRHAPTAAAEPRGQGWQPTPKTSAGWDVHEAPASACFKFRVGSLELLYTLRGVDDAELLRRMAATLPTLQEVMAVCEDRAAQRVAAPTAPAPATPAQPDLQALVQQAVAAVLAQAQERPSANGHASPPPPPPVAPRATPAPSAPEPDDQQTGFCSLHELHMKRHHNERGTWYSHKLPTGAYCKGR
jgi:hypothetical protein